MKPAVLFVHSNTELYGADFILAEVVRALRGKVRPIMALPGEGELTNLLSREGIRIIYTRESILRRVNFKPFKLFQLVFNIILDVRRLVQIIRQEDVKLVYSNTGAVVTGAIAATLCRIPNLYHIHEIIVHPSWLAKGITRFVLNNSSEVVAVSNAVREQILRFSRPGDPAVRIIHNGLDPSIFDSDEDVKITRREMGAGPENILFGVIGRIHPWKGQTYIVEAARLLLDVYSQARFVIIGGTFLGYEHLLDELKEGVRELGLETKVKILPYRRDIPRLMQALDVLVLPSTLPDPLPTVVLEAMAARRPVVATAHGGALEMVVHGETGLLAPYHDAAGFAEALLELAGDAQKRKCFGEAGRKRLEEKFSRDRFHREICRYVWQHLPISVSEAKEKSIDPQFIH